MTTVDVSDLPEFYAQAVQAVAETFRKQLAMTNQESKEGSKTPRGLPKWPLGAPDKLTREDYYDDRC